MGISKSYFYKKIFKGIKVFIRFANLKKMEIKVCRVEKRKNFGILAIATNPESRGKGFGKKINGVS